MYILQPMDEKAARLIINWNYPEPWSMYSFQGDENELPEMLAGEYYAALDETGELVGYFCFGQPAQVPGGHTVDAYDDQALDIGLGMRPDLTGRGLGLSFLQAGLSYAEQQLGCTRFRLSVLRGNKRAIKVYERAGFVECMTFTSKTPSNEALFVLMLRA